MKISTIKTIYWIAVAVFWALLIADLVTPGKAPAILDIAWRTSVYVLLSASFYVMGTQRTTKNSPTNEMSN